MYKNVTSYTQSHTAYNYAVDRIIDRNACLLTELLNALPHWIEQSWKWHSALFSSSCKDQFVVKNTN